MKILVLGATGATGKLVVEQALEAGHEVTAFARNPADVTAKHPKLRVVQGDGTNVEAVQRAVAGHDVVVSALGSRTRNKNTILSESARNTIDAMKKAGVRRLIWLSAAGVGDSLPQTQRSSFIMGRILIPLMLKDVFADAAIADESIRQSGLEWCVVRPVGLNNRPLKGNIRVITDGSKLPSVGISRADVAKFMLEQATQGTYLGKMPVLCD